MKKRKILFLDLDDTLADFGGAFGKAGVDETQMYEVGFFKNLKVVNGALVGVRRLIKMGFNIQILTQPVANSAHCYSEKAQWVSLWFPELVGNLNMVQDKGMMKGHYLVDDNAEKWKDKFEANGGKFIHFQYNRLNNPTMHSNAAIWDRIVNYFANENPFEEPSEFKRS